MKIVGIKESGCSNILRWAIKGKAHIQSDAILQGLINNETFYLVQVNDVHFLELFELTKIYRDKIRIIEENISSIPNKVALDELFKGKYNDVEISTLVTKVLEKWNALALQMNTDNDIIQNSTALLFLPMLNRRFNVEIPINFESFVKSFDSKESFDAVFNENYPNTLKEKIINPDVTNFKTVFMSILFQATWPSSNPDKYNKYIDRIKYNALKAAKTDKLYKLKLIGFYKDNPITKTRTKVNLFMTNKETMNDDLYQLAHTNSPMKIEFAVQLPLQYMQMLLSSYGRNEIEVNYESDIKTIVDDGIQFKNFITPVFDRETEDEEELNRIKEFDNALSAYEVRIADAKTDMMKVLTPITGEDFDTDLCASFAMLPTIYSARAVITLDMNFVDKYANHPNPVLSSMFKEMLEMAIKINNDMGKAK